MDFESTHSLPLAPTDTFGGNLVGAIKPTFKESQVKAAYADEMFNLTAKLEITKFFVQYKFPDAALT